MSATDPVEDPETVTRREFTVQSVLALLSGFIITISEACGSESGPTPVTTSSPGTSSAATSSTTSPSTSTSSSSTVPTSSAPTTSTPSTTTTYVPVDINGAISANHGHIAIVTGAQIVSGVAVTLNIQGLATHNHTVNLSPTDLTNLRNRQVVIINSSFDAGHLHMVTFTPV